MNNSIASNLTVVTDFSGGGGSTLLVGPTDVDNSVFAYFFLKGRREEGRWEGGLVGRGVSWKDQDEYMTECVHSTRHS